MPGAPTGKACNACRKLKKKCDQKQPSCSRCTRLTIPCVGSGQLRYVFKGSTFSTPAGSSVQKIPSPASSPSNEITRLVSSFTHLLGFDDPSWDISIYGPFFDEIPTRLGTNEALDSATQAFVSAFPSIRSRRHTGETYQLCMFAVNKLRTSLDCPVTASQPETLCAVYMTMICQGWLLQKGDYYAGHGDAILHLVTKAARNRHFGAFETSMHTTLQVLLVLVSLIDCSLVPSLSFCDDLLPHYGPTPPAEFISTVESLQLRNLTKVMRLIRDFDNNIPGLRYAYDLMISDALVMSTGFNVFTQQAAAAPGGRLSSWSKKLHVRYASSYATLLYLALGLHRGLALAHALSETQDEELDYLVRESINLTEISTQYRPLGASSVPFCLVMAYAASTNQGLRAQMDNLLHVWEGDFDAMRWRELAHRTKARRHEHGWLYLTNGTF